MPPELTVLEIQSYIGSAVFLAAVYAFFFTLGLFRRKEPSRHLAWFLPAVLCGCFGYAMVLALIPRLCQSLTIKLLVPYFAFRGYRRGGSSATWIDSSHLWGIWSLLLAALFGCWAIQLRWFTPSLSGGLFGGLGPVLMETRAGWFRVDLGSPLTDEWLKPTVELVFDAAAFLLILSVAWVACFLSRRCHSARAVQFALLAQPILLQRFVPEASVCMLGAMVLAYRLDGQLPREATQRGLGTNLLTTLGLFLAANWLTDAIVWKFVALSSAPEWDVVCVGYAALGLVLGRCAALWKPTPSGERQPRFSADKELVRSRFGAASGMRPLMRLDTLILILPYLAVAFVVGLANWLRGWHISLTVLVVTVLVELALVSLQLIQVMRAWRVTLARLSVTADGMDSMREFSQSAHRSSQLDHLEFHLLIVLPIVIPSVVGLYVGISTPTGGLITAATLLGTGTICRLIMALQQSRLPAVLVLGTSTDRTIQVHWLLARAISPLRAVSLLQFDTTHKEATLVPPRRDCLRTIWDEEWPQVVGALIDLAAVIVIDGRDVSEATLDELEALRLKGRLSSTVLVTEEDGTAPLLEAWRQRNAAPFDTKRFLALVEEAAAIEVLRDVLGR